MSFLSTWNRVKWQAACYSRVQVIRQLYCVVVVIIVLLLLCCYCYCVVVVLLLCCCCVAVIVIVLLCYIDVVLLLWLCCSVIVLLWLLCCFVIVFLLCCYCVIIVLLLSCFVIVLCCVVVVMLLLCWCGCVVRKQVVLRLSYEERQCIKDTSWSSWGPKSQSPVMCDTVCLKLWRVSHSVKLEALFYLSTNFASLEYSQAAPACPSDKSSVNMN
jgi:hypothetical protein